MPNTKPCVKFDELSVDWPAFASDAHLEQASFDFTISGLPAMRLLQMEHLCTPGGCAVCAAGAMAVAGKLAQVVNGNLHQAGFLCLPQNTMSERSFEKRRKDGDDINRQGLWRRP